MRGVFQLVKLNTRRTQRLGQSAWVEEQRKSVADGDDERARGTQLNKRTGCV